VTPSTSCAAVGGQILTSATTTTAATCQCSAGYQGNGTTCTACNAGYFNATVNGTCSLCPSGKYTTSTTTGATACTTCPSGQTNAAHTYCYTVTSATGTLLPLGCYTSGPGGIAAFYDPTTPAGSSCECQYNDGYGLNCIGARTRITTYSCPAGQTLSGTTCLS
jgi:hypothetical protein